MQTKLLEGILKEAVTLQVNDETIYIPPGENVVILIVYSDTKNKSAQSFSKKEE